MLGNDQRRIRLALALTMALPGTPILMYGDEIGMGEDLSLPGRLAVRSPMQWSPRHASRFSTAGKLSRPARAEAPFGYRTVNVLDQRHQPGSLHSWVAHAVRVRRECPELGWGRWRALDVGDLRVLAIGTRWRGGAAWSRYTTCPPNPRRCACRATWTTSGSLLTQDVEVQAVACLQGCDQCLQLPGRGRLGPCRPPALQRDPGGKPGAHRP